MKKRLFKILIVAVMPLFLTSCEGFSISFGIGSSSSDSETTTSEDDSTSSEVSSDDETSSEDSSEDISSEDSSEDISSEESSDPDSSSEDSSSVEEDTREVTDNGYYENPSSYGASASKDNLNLATLKSGYTEVVMPSTGNSKILVVPIEYSDYSFDTGYETMLQNAFFGEASDTDWESVSSYYYKASNSLLNIEGAVAPAVTLDMTLSEARSYESTEFSTSVLETSLTLLADVLDLSEYDSNSDGYIDSVWFVNSAPYDSSKSTTWAYTYWYFGSSTFGGMSASSYAWGSIDFLERSVSDSSLAYGYNADCHTMIHETGHLLGLDDYYSYDYNGDAPAGCIDMMDYNVGDHMEFSKYLLGWTDPVVLTEDYLTENNNTITINSSDFAENTAYILPIQSEGKIEDFNYTPFDEYLLIEYYSPTGLDEHDSIYPFENIVNGYQTPGVVVYHVNSRVGKLTATTDGLVWDGYVYDKLGAKENEMLWGRTYLYYPIYSNTESYCYDTSFAGSNKNFYQGRLVSMLPQTGQKTTTSYYGFDSLLYTEGTSFMTEDGSYTDFVFDDGSKPLYGFSVTEAAETSATLTFSKN